jgi:hypothetical protein
MVQQCLSRLFQQLVPLNILQHKHLSYTLLVFILSLSHVYILLQKGYLCKLKGGDDGTLKSSTLLFILFVDKGAMKFHVCVGNKDPYSQQLYEVARNR